LALTTPSEDNRNKPKYTAQKLVDIYSGEQGKSIFTKRDNWSLPWFKPFLEPALSMANKFLNLGLSEPKELLNSKYTSKRRDEVFREILGENTLLTNCLTEIFIPSYDTQLRLPVFFTSNIQQEVLEGSRFHKLCEGFKSYQAAMATSAAPTYFKPYNDVFSIRGSERYSLIDGGVFANNPTAIAIVQAMKSYQDEHNQKLDLNDILVVSIGTGYTKPRYDFKDVQNWGLLNWSKPIISITFDGQSDVVALQLEQLLSQERYYRFSSFLPPSAYSVKDNVSEDIDDTTDKNIANLKRLGDTICQQNSNQLNNLCQILS
jgi:patatin-like phospholipase/acyl hydrolase